MMSIKPIIVFTVVVLLTGCAGYGKIPMTTEVHGRLIMAQNLAKTGDYTGALRQFEWIYEEYLKTYPKNTKAIEFLTLVLLGQKKMERAADVHSRLLAMRPDDAQTHFVHGSILLELEDRAGAKEQFQQALACDPKHVHALNSLGYTYIEDGRVDEGLAMVQQAYDKKPGNSAILDSMGWGYFKKGDAELGRDYLLEAAQRSKSPETQRHLAEVYTALGNPEKAAFHREQALAYEEEATRDKTEELLKDVRSPVLF